MRGRIPTRVMMTRAGSTRNQALLSYCFIVASCDRHFGPKMYGRALPDAERTATFTEALRAVRIQAGIAPQKPRRQLQINTRDPRREQPPEPYQWLLRLSVP